MSAPVAILRQPYAKVWIDGETIATDKTNVIQSPSNQGIGILGASVSYGFDLRVAEATVHCTDKPSWATYGSQIHISLAASQQQANRQGPRFVGTIVEFDYQYWPRQVDLICRGWLYAAQIFQPVSGSFDFGSDPYPQNGGIDLSNGGAGTPDFGIILNILQIAQVQGYVGPIGQIGGTSHVFGTVIPESCRWAEGQSALDAIDMFDSICLGYRTFDVPGAVVRKQISANPSAANVVATFTEGVDIFSGQGQYSILNTYNQFVVTGGTKKAVNAPYSCTVPSSAPAVPVPEQTSSALIEKSLVSDPGPGLSCQEVATWRQGEVGHPLASIRLDTPRDDLIQPGDTVRINSTWRLGATQQLYWVQRVDTELTETGVFSQTLTCIGTAT